MRRLLGDGLGGTGYFSSARPFRICLVWRPTGPERALSRAARGQKRAVARLENWLGALFVWDGCMKIIKTALKIVFAAFFIFAGITHFTNPPFFLKIMPDYIPESLHLPAVHVSGVFEVLLGVCLLIPRTTRVAAWGLIALLIAVFPANIYAYQHSREIFPDVEPGMHFWRLPLQGVLIAWAYWYTRPERAKVDRADDAAD
jgi:uncharacterized membrane protein